MTKTQVAGYSFIVIAIIILAVVGYMNSTRTQVPIVFSEKDMLTTLWSKYKEEYIEPSTYRAIDKDQSNITTSEGQSYTMLRAVWMDDKATFDGAYAWTKDNLKRSEDNLHSWLFGRRADGTFGVITDRGGYNSATDAEIDIAVALIFAGNRWQQQNYIDEAKSIIADIWNKNVIIVQGKPYLTSNNLEKLTSEKTIINVSYIAPYAFRMFAEIDPTHDWHALIDSSYDILLRSTAAPLDKSRSAHIPPDWIVLNKTTGSVESPRIENLTTNFSYDALRTPWRIALDHVWYQEPRAKEYLNSLTFLSEEWQRKGYISSVYAHDGSVIKRNEIPAMYGGVIGYFKASDPKVGKKVYEQKLKYLYNPDTSNWKRPLGYYDSNWAWFGIGLYSDLLPNLSRP